MEQPKFQNELVCNHIFAFLNWNDLLALRGVCKDFKNAVDNSIINELGGIPSNVEIIVEEATHPWRDISAFLKLGFPASTVYLHNTTASGFFNNDNMPQFLENIGWRIRKLKVHKFTVYPTGNELSFHECLENMQSLKIEIVVKPKNLPSTNITENITHQIMIPDRWENLMSIQVHSGVRSSIKVDHISSGDTVLLGSMLLRKCKMLQHFELGIMEFSSLDLIRHFQDVLAHVQVRGFENPDEPNLKIYAFPVGFSADARKIRNISPTFLQLCSMFSAHDVKVQNVPARMFKSFDPSLHQADIISSVVDSMNSLHPTVLNVPLEQMTRLTLSTANQSALKADVLKNRRPWPSMEHLRLIINSGHLKGGSGHVEKEDKISIKEFIDLLFGNAENLPTLKRLELHYETYAKIFTAAIKDNCPNFTDIALFCPNITKLELTNVPGDYASGFSELWAGLTALEEVTLTNCKQLSDACFIGRKGKKSVFLKLENLRKLTLNKLDQMPLITDNAFILVFRHIDLTEFVISSKAPMKNVSIAGIFSLLSGDLIYSIEKFPFTGWKIQNVGIKEQRNFEMQFSSSCFKSLKTRV